MSYRNIFSIFGAKWIDQNDIEMVLKKYPESDFEVYVTFSDKSDMFLKDCTGKETNVEKIVFAYRDGTNKLDPEPFIYYVCSPFNITYFLTSCDIDAHFASRCKNRKVWPQTRNEDPKEILKMRTAVREKFVHYMQMSDIDWKVGEQPDAPVYIPVNSWKNSDRGKILRFLERLDSDGIQTVIEVRFNTATIDQLQRLDTEMEFGDLDEVLEISEEAEREDD